MSHIKAFFSITLNGLSDVFLVSEYESKKCLQLKILDIKQNECYVGQASELDLRTQAAGIRLTFNDYIKEIKKALFQFTGSEYTYIYSLIKESENYLFKWKSVDKEETVINLGKILMHKQSHVTIISEVLDSLSKEIQLLKNKIENYENELTKHKNQTSAALDQLSETIVLKENLEKEMFAKFLVILNEKKKEIRNKKGQNDLKQTTNNIKITKEKPTLNLVSDSSEDEVTDNTNHPGTSKSTKRGSFLSFEDDSEVLVKPSKMRNRKVPFKKTEEVEYKRSEKIKKIILEDNDDDFLLDNL